MFIDIYCVFILELIPVLIYNRTDYCTLNQESAEKVLYTRD